MSWSYSLLIIHTNGKCSLHFTQIKRTRSTFCTNFCSFNIVLGQIKRNCFERKKKRPDRLSAHTRGIDKMFVSLITNDNRWILRNFHFIYVYTKWRDSLKTKWENTKQQQQRLVLKTELSAYKAYTHTIRTHESHVIDKKDLPSPPSRG